MTGSCESVSERPLLKMLDNLGGIGSKDIKTSRMFRFKTIPVFRFVSFEKKMIGNESVCEVVIDNKFIKHVKTRGEAIALVLKANEEF